MQIKYLLSGILVLLSLISNIETMTEKNETLLPRRMVLCSGKEISPFITYIKNDSLEAAGKCYGYANCTACTTCNFCAHCNSGGICGVCTNMGIFKPTYPPPTPPKPKIETPKAPTPKTNLSENNDYSYIANSDVNLRSEPYTSSAIITKLQMGDRIIKMEKSDNLNNIQPFGIDYWYKVMTDDNRVGWVFGKLITDEIELSKTSLDERLKVEGSFTYIKGDHVNVRSEPTVLKNNVIKQLNTNDQCKIQERTTLTEVISPYGEDYWYKVEYKNVIGWVFGKFLSEELIETDYTTSSINGRFVNLRLNPDENSIIMGRVYLNEKCMILDKSPFETTLPRYGTYYWYKIRTNRNEGWIFGKFLDITSD
jgi:uncharacterized protein YgiM (DUF1202 family)